MNALILIVQGFKSVRRCVMMVWEESQDIKIETKTSVVRAPEILTMPHLVTMSANINICP